MVDPNPSGERLRALEVQSVNLERAVDRVEKKVDANAINMNTRIDGLDGRIDALNATVTGAIGGFKVAIWLYAAGVAILAIVAPYVAHMLGVAK
jgi:hypothetical protein